MIHATLAEIAAWEATDPAEKARVYVDFLVDWAIIARGTDDEYEANVQKVADQLYRRNECPIP